MSRWFLVLLCPFVWSSRTFAQPSGADAVPDTLGWGHDLVGGLSMSQVAFKDWAQGGESALAWTISLDGQSTRKKRRTHWANAYKFAFGQTKQGDKGFRKTEDRLELETVLTYNAGTYVNPFVAMSLTTQFTGGFEYDNKDNKTQVSTFFDPAYLTQSIGAGYRPIRQIASRFGFALRETITRNFNSFADDPGTPEVEKINVEGGFKSVIQVKWRMTGDIAFTGKGEMFLSLDRPDEPILRNDATLALKVNRYITTNINVQVVKDVLASPRTQIKQVLSIGVSYALL